MGQSRTRIFLTATFFVICNIGLVLLSKISLSFSYRNSMGCQNIKSKLKKNSSVIVACLLLPWKTKDFKALKLHDLGFSKFVSANFSLLRSL